MRRIVLDTNALIQCISKRSRYYNVWQSFMDGETCLCVSNEILNEYEEVIERLMNENTAQNTIGLILNNDSTLFFSPSYQFNLIKADPDDNKFVDCAIAANARFIVTNDSHYRCLKDIDFPKVDCIGLETFSNLL